MRALAEPLLNIFAKKMVLEVPLFQRQYVWKKETQWEPLWEDISHKFTDHLMGRSGTPVHFLGAIVLDTKQTPSTHLERRQIIDGQQRLTTFQLFLSAFRDFCKENGIEELAKECDEFILNRGMMPNPEQDQYKVFPSQADRPYFIDVISTKSSTELEKKYPLVWRRRAKSPNPRHKMIDAYFYFYKEIRAFFLPDSFAPDNQPPFAEIGLSTRIETCFIALKQSLYMVYIDLDPADDPQVIFETLNARGEPLLPADLMRNYIFLRAARQGEKHEELYNMYWQKFDEPFWREEIRQGRLPRPRSDIFMQHYLSAAQGSEIPIKHLYVEYKYWIEKHKPFPNVEDELKHLAKSGEYFKRIYRPKNNDPLKPISEFLSKFDMSTPVPFLLYLLQQENITDELPAIFTIIESYLVRRAICGLPIKSYNKIFLTLIRMLHGKQANAEIIRQHLSGLSGETAVWPDNDQLREHWLTSNAYYELTQQKIVYILKEISELYTTKFNESFDFGFDPTIEHILPQKWQQNWPLPNGMQGLDYYDALHANDSDERKQGSLLRENLKNTFGNLTLLTHILNSSVSNSKWEVKKKEIMLSSLLPINQMLVEYDNWDENAIQLRALEMFDKVIVRWPAP